MFILSRPNDAEEDFTSFRKLNGRILCPPSVKILVSVFPLSFLPSALAMIGIRCAAWLSKAAEEARPLWGSFMAAAFAIQSGSSLSKGGEKRSNKAHLNYSKVVKIEKVVYLHRSVDMSNLFA